MVVDPWHLANQALVVSSGLAVQALVFPFDLEIDLDIDLVFDLDIDLVFDLDIDLDIDLVFDPRIAQGIVLAYRGWGFQVLRETFGEPELYDFHGARL